MYCSYLFHKFDFGIERKDAKKMYALYSTNNLFELLIELNCETIYFQSAFSDKNTKNKTILCNQSATIMQKLFHL